MNAMRESGGWLQWLIVIIIVGGSVVTTGCRRFGMASGDSDDDSSNANRTPTSPPAREVELPARVNIAAPMEDMTQWLTVEAIRGDVKGAWAEGSFDPKSNKIIINTHDVQQFTLDVSRIPIRWEKLVIIRIDGRNSEMVKRDQALYRFDLDDHNQWVVQGPS